MSREVTVIRLSDGEKTSGKMALDNVGRAVAAMHRDGLVVLENAVDLEHVAKLNSILSVEADAMARLPTTHFNDVCDNASDMCNRLSKFLVELCGRKAHREHVTRSALSSRNDVRRYLGKFTGSGGYIIYPWTRAGR